MPHMLHEKEIHVRHVVGFDVGCESFQRRHINLINGMSCIDGVTEIQVQNHNRGRAPKRNSRRSGREKHGARCGSNGVKEMSERIM